MSKILENSAAPVALAAVRGEYGEIYSITMPDGTVIGAKAIIERFKVVLPETFADFDKKKRGDSLNVDLYGYDAEQGVAVIQIRHFYRRHAKWFAEIHKDYVLVGKNEETGEFFRHPISGQAVHAGIRRDETDPVSAVRAAQRWMWNVNDNQLAAGIRQGDILVVPCRGKPAKAEAIEEKVVVVASTHEVHGSAFMRDPKGVIFALAPTVRHTKQQHCAVYGDGDGWHSIRVGREAPTWEWGVRLGD